jgi:hypothetical protein
MIEVVVRNSLGQELTRYTFDLSSKLDITIPGEAGIYFVEVIAEEKQAVVKVVKQ